MVLARCMSSVGAAALRFDGQTAIITGAGRGLGREYALLLASRGANVIVNDFGGDRSGRQHQQNQHQQQHQKSNEPSKESPSQPPPPLDELPAEQVVAEIKSRWPGAKAIANYESISSVEGSRRLVESALGSFGRVDILINNAGILRDKSFAKMTLDDWDQVHAVHLRGSFLVSRACWPHMRKQEYGKILMTSSTSGLFGNFGQSNYSAAKMGLVGLSNTLAIEGGRSNIACNSLVPLAASRLTRDILPEDLMNRLQPAYVAPMAAWLCHRDCKASGLVVEAAGKWFGAYKLHRSRGKYLANLGTDTTVGDAVEQVADNFEQIMQFDERAKHVGSFGEHMAELMDTFQGPDQ